MEKKSRKSRPLPPQGIQTMDNLRDIRILAHPLRLRILGAFREPRTTKQVAEILGEKHTRLYHHVQALERAKVIRLTKTRPNRGTIERYYQATAAQFEAAPSVFHIKPEKGRKSSDLETIANALLETARKDVATEVHKNGDPQAGRRAGLIAARLILRGSMTKVERALQRQVSQSMKKLRARDEKSFAPGGIRAKDGIRAYALTIILCPTDEA